MIRVAGSGRNRTPVGRGWEVAAAMLLGLVLGWVGTLWWSAYHGLPLGVSAPSYQPDETQPDRMMAGTYMAIAQGYQLTADAHQPAGAAVFLGDSHTQGLAVAAVAPAAVNYGVGGLTTEGLLRQLPALRSLNTARVVVLMIGSNDLPADDQDAFEVRLQAIADGIPAPLVWHAIPRNRRVSEEVTAEANAAIRRICKARPRCRYAETEFAPEDFQKDGSHLSPSGYRKWMASLRAAVTAS